MCLGFVLSKYENPDGREVFEGDDELNFFIPQGPGFGEHKIRSAAVGGDSTIHVFSCMEFNRDETTNRYFIEFCMNEDDFQRYANYFLYVFRSDRWDQVGYITSKNDVMRLKDAKCVPIG